MIYNNIASVTHPYIRSYMLSFFHMIMSALVSVRGHTRTHTHIHAYTHIHIHTRTHTHIRNDITVKVDSLFWHFVCFRFSFLDAAH